MKHYEQNHNYMQAKKNFHREMYENLEASLQNDIKNKLINEEKYGKFGNLIIIGTIDRIIGYERQVLDEAMQKSYSYGYDERGSRLLAGEFLKGIYTYEQQRNYGINDVINNVPENHLEELKKYPAYLEGRMYQIGKNAYDFITENGITLESYINLMKIIYPEVKNPAFKSGYYDRKIEKEKSKGI